MLHPYYVTDRNLKVRFMNNLDSHHINHANSELTIIPNYPEFGIEVRYINKIMKKSSVIYARLMNQYNFKYHTILSARFEDKQNEDNQVLDENELLIILIISHNLTQSDLDNIDIKPQLELQIQQQVMKDSEWRFDKINSITICFYQTCIMNGSNYVKILLRSNAILNFENNDKYCFIWSILASLYPCNNNHPNRFSNYKHYFDELNFNGFCFTSGFKCNDVHKINELNNLSANIFELIFHQDQNKWRHKLMPIEVSKNISERVNDSAIYKNPYIPFTKLDVLGDHNKKFICRRCLSSYTSENMLMKHKLNCRDDNITTIKTSNESHICCKMHFHKNSLYFRIYAGFEADNEKDNSSIGIKTTIIFKKIGSLMGLE